MNNVVAIIVLNEVSKIPTIQNNTELVMQSYIIQQLPPSVFTILKVRPYEILKQLFE